MKLSIREIAAPLAVAVVLLLVAFGASQSTTIAKSTPTGDSCGYTAFAESTVIRTTSQNDHNTNAGGQATFSIWYADEHGMTLGVNPGVSPFPPVGSYPPQGIRTTAGSLHSPAGVTVGSVDHPSVGDKTKFDAAGHPDFPAVYLTDLTVNGATSKLGDWQSKPNANQADRVANAARAVTPSFVSGTWDIATGTTTPPTIPTSGAGADPTAQNPNKIQPILDMYGPGADAPPTFANINDTQYVTEIRLHASDLVDNSGASPTALIPGHLYRIQILDHDGDHGLDPGEACFQYTPPQSAASPVKLADAPLVSAGDPIGFKMSVKNVSTDADAVNVTLDDNLPGNAVADSISWSVVADGSGNCTSGAGTSATTCNVTGFTGAGACAISGSPPTQTLHCVVGTIPKNTTSNQFVVHVVSDTAFTDSSHNSCDNGNNGIYDNTVTLKADSQPSQPTSNATTQVLCPDLHITKTADSTDVEAGGEIGFVIHVENKLPAPGTAKAVSISDGLPVCPAQFNCSWSLISVTPSGGKVLPPTPCAIAPATGPGAQTLSCSFGDLAPGEDVEMHVTSPTTFDGSLCKAPSTINNPLALGSASNNPPVQDAEGLTLECPSTSLDKTIDKIHVDYFITDTNDGNVSLSNPTVDDPVCQNSTPPSTPVYVSGDINPANGKLDPGESWKFKCTATFSGATGTDTNTATADGLTPSNHHLTYCSDPATPPANTLCDQDEKDSISITVP
jgi:uncharacterized repeat protein (TIGR01451 family)